MRRSYPAAPLIKLGEKFTNIEDFLERIPYGIPNIVHLEHLTVAGDVFFGANVTLKVRQPSTHSLRCRSYELICVSLRSNATGLS
jgi:UDP-N-acetylglucosamine pyrophosphorylase